MAKRGRPKKATVKKVKPEEAQTSYTGETQVFEAKMTGLYESPKPEPVKEKTVEKSISESYKGVKSYHCGMKSESPLQEKAINGYSFCKSINPVISKGRSPAETVRANKPGQIYKLTYEKVQSILSAAKKLIVRTVKTASGHRTQIYSIENPHYSPNQNDAPITDYIYMYEVPENYNAELASASLF